MRTGCAVSLATLFLLAVGGYGLSEALSNPRPKVVSFDEFVKAKPEEGWFRIRQCVLDIADVTYEEKRGKVKQVYVPVYSAGNPDRKTIHLLFSTDNLEALLDLNDGKKGDGTREVVQRLAEVAQTQEPLQVKRDIEGMVSRTGSTGLNLLKIVALNKSLSKEFRILEGGREPSMGLAVGLLSLGVLLPVGTTLLGLRRRRSASGVEATLVAGAGASPAPEAPSHILVSPTGEELPPGSRLVVFSYCISIVILTFRLSSRPYLIRPGESVVGKALGYSLISILCGWWGIPWGPIYTIGSLFTNLTGGKDVTLRHPAPAPTSTN